MSNLIIMKKMKIKYLIAGIAAIMAAAACESNIPEAGTMDIDVEQIILSDVLRSGLKIYVGQTVELEDSISVLPENATDRMQTYLSSDEDIASVSPQGVLSALAKGNCTIDVYVGSKGLYESFDVTVDDVPPVSMTSLSFRNDEADFEFEKDGQTVDLSAGEYLIALPTDHTEKIKFTSSAPDVASISENGMLTIHKLGTTTVTATAAENSALTDDILITVYRIENTEYDRTGWSMTCSQDPLPDVSGRNNSLTAMLDGTDNTVFCITRPGKSSGGIDLKNVDAASYEISYTIDMGVSQTVNYFKLVHLSNKSSDLGTRMAGYTEILGSEDGTEFTTIVKNVKFAEHANVLENTETEHIGIPETTCRYIKFVMVGTDCYDPSGGNKGNTAQIKEMYIGYDKHVTE